MYRLRISTGLEGFLARANDGPTFGWSATVLTNTVNPWTWDETNKAQIAPDARHARQQDRPRGSTDRTALLGDEIIQWRNANVLASGLYELSGLRYGRRGTEWATGTHTMNACSSCQTTVFIARPACVTEINKIAYYKGIPDGGVIGRCAVKSFVFMK